MKRIKIVILLIAIILITGCSGNYNLNINKDLTVSEELSVILEDEASSYDKINELFINNNIDNDKYRVVTEGNNLNVTYKESYDSLEDYLLNSFLYKQLFEKISYNTDRNEFSLEASNIFNTTSSKLNYSNSIKSLRINVTTPLDIIDENSDTSSEDTYTWTIDNKTKEKDAYLIFSINSKRISFGSGLVIISFALVILVLIGMGIKKILNSRKI